MKFGSAPATFSIFFILVFHHLNQDCRGKAAKQSLDCTPEHAVSDPHTGAVSSTPVPSQAGEGDPFPACGGNKRGVTAFPREN